MARGQRTWGSVVSDPKNAVLRITDYLSSGGLFNPEFMEHDKVRDTMIDALSEIDTLLKAGDAMRKALGVTANGSCNCSVCEAHRTWDAVTDKFRARPTVPGSAPGGQS